MHRFIFRLTLALSFLPWLLAPSPPDEGNRQDDDGFVPIFNGETLSGWHAVPDDSADDWTAKDGVISGKGSRKRLSYLVFDEEVDDFELRFEYRMMTDGNSGVEIRGQVDESGKRPFEGYHADFGHVGIGPQVLGAWDFHFAQRKEPPCPLGTRLVINEDGSWDSEHIENAVTTKEIRKRDWNEVRVIAEGQRFQFFINGRLASEFTDNSKERPLERGIIGLQLHDKGMHVQFRNVHLKRSTRSNSGESDFSELEVSFRQDLQPFLRNHCLSCHGADEPEAQLNLSGYSTAASVADDHQTWEIILQRLEANEMPPKDATPQPSARQRRTAIRWIRSAREDTALRNAGDPGPVLARRLSNAEYNYSIRDLTGVDIRPTKTFPVDPANEAGFDNSGESLTMSPALLNKYLEAARMVSEHLVLTPTGITFAPHPVMTDTDRDRYCVRRIVDFYLRQPTDPADYFFAAWQYDCRNQHGRSGDSLDEIARQNNLSAKYLRTVWELLTDQQNDVGPIARLRQSWRDLPREEDQIENVRERCNHLRDGVVALRQKLIPRIPEIKIEGVHKGSQTVVLWRNRQYAANRRSFDPHRLQAPDTESDEPDDIDPALHIPEGERGEYEAAFARYCSVFPDAFYISERGRDYVDEDSKQMGERGRLLSAGFHSMMGYFRDDAPLYDLILTEAEQQELDALWDELNFVASAPQRQYSGFLWFERTDSPFMRDEQFDFARAESKEALTEPLVQKLAGEYRAKAKSAGAGPIAFEAIDEFFREINDQIRWVEDARQNAEPRHLAAIVGFAARAFRRELSSAEREDFKAFYQSLRDDGLSHEEAIQDTLVSVLMSPHFCYRLNHGGDGTARTRLTDDELASRLSYFLWASIPDDELLRVAGSGDLNRSNVIEQQVRRMLQDDRVRGLATEFGGNWLDFRRFEAHNAVDRERFPQFTDELRQAMFEEPIRLFVDIAQHDRSVLEFLDADHTFVNQPLADHYGISTSPDAAHSVTPTANFDSANEIWWRVDNASDFGRGGLLPMSVFLTQNAPGLRTSPVKRGYWVVRRLLGERIPPPPPDVPELPSDESQLGDLTLREALALHREHASCSGCHERFDSIGLVFEGFGPVGERRNVDLGGRPVDTTAAFPGGHVGNGVTGLRAYLRDHRREEYLDNLCRKLLSYALGRSLILPDELLVREMRTKLEENEFRFSSLITAIVASEQFQYRRSPSSTIIGTSR